MVRPVTVHDVEPCVVQVLKSGDDVTVYPVMFEPPLNAGAVHDTVAWPDPATAETAVGGFGFVEGVAEDEASEESPVPFTLVAVTLTV